jgi:hypothetical protein
LQYQWQFNSNNIAGANADSLFLMNLASNDFGAYRVIVSNAFGSVGVGHHAAANRLEVEGNASKTAAGNWLANSDARIKTGVRPVNGALEKLARVRLVSFRYTEEYRAQHLCIEDREYLNVIAQEFQKVFPDHLKRNGERLADGARCFRWIPVPLTIYSAAAIQESNRKMEEDLARKNAEIEELKRSAAELKELLLEGKK